MRWTAVSGEGEGMYPLVVICGPTATGKSDIALRLASEVGGEIISADSMQVYRGFDIGTAKPTRDERARVVHHMIDVADPDETFNAARYAEAVAGIVPDVVGRGHLPIMTGGTGLYIRAATQGLLFPSPGRDEAYRAGLEKIAGEQGSQVLHEQLLRVDRQAAARIHPNDRVRLIRALEVYHLTGEPLSAHFENRPPSPPYDCLSICLTRDRNELYARIDMRTVKMMEAGFVQEVRTLLGLGVSRRSGPMTALGYAEVVDHLRGMSTYEELVTLIQRNTRRYAKRQLSWFRREPDMDWINMTGQSEADVVAQIRLLTAGRFSSRGEYLE